MALMRLTKLLVCLLPFSVGASTSIGGDGACKRGGACENDPPNQASVLSPPADISALFQSKTAQVLTARVPSKDDQNMASAAPRMKKLMELNATVHDIEALGKAAMTPEFAPIIADLVRVIEGDLQEKIKDDQSYAQSKVTERIAGLTETTDIAVEDKGDADDFDTSLDQCITEEKRLLQAYETCTSEEAVLETEKASAVYCDHPDLELASEYKDPPQLESSLAVDFSQGLAHVQQQLDDYLDPVKKWIEAMKIKAEGDQVKWAAADLRCKQKSKELLDKTTECGTKLGSWRTQREKCLHAKSEKQKSLCEFGHTYQAKCVAKTAYDDLRTDITGTGTSFSQPDRKQEWRLTTKLVCVLNVLKEYISGAVDTCAKSDDEAAEEFENDVGAVDLKQTTYDLLTSQAKFTCAEASIGFASGLLWTVPENTDGVAEWIPKSTEYTKATGYKYAIESDSGNVPFDFCLGKANHPTAPACGSSFDCTAGTGLWQKPAETQCYLAEGCTSADCCGGTVQA